MPLGTIVAKVGAKIVANAPKILMVTSFVLGGAAVASAIVETPKAMKDYDAKLEEQEIKGIDIESPRAKTERAAVVGKHYILTTIFLAGSVAAGAKSFSMVTRSLQNVTNGWLCADRINQAYVEHNKKILGEEKEKLFRADLYADEDSGVHPDEGLITHTGNGNTLFKDEWSGRYFYSSRNAVENAFLTLNTRIISENFISVNEANTELGLERTDAGDQIGWDIKDGLITYDFTSVLWEDGRQCVYLSYSIKPLRRYDPDEYY